MALFQQLYTELIETPPNPYLTTKKVLDFVKEEDFQKSLPKHCLLDNLEENIKHYSDDIASVLKLALKMSAHEFAVKKGLIFGFGKQIDDQTGTRLKRSAASFD